MRAHQSLLASIGLLAAQVQLARCHAAIIAVAGDNGVKGSAFGIVSSVPRDGTDEQPFQIDTSVFKNLIADPCGQTLAGGSVNIATSLATAEKAGKGQLPALTDDLVVSMTLHQVNGDGGGPFTAMFNADGTGLTWDNATVITQAPGENGLLLGGPFNSLFEAQLPAGTVCTGGANKDACLVRVSNGGAAVGAGPFGGCVPVQMPAGTAGGNTTTGAGSGTNGNNRNSRNPNNKLQRSNDISQLKRQISRLVRRLSISPSEANDLITASGSALNVPIDLLAGQDDASSKGGNSTTAKNAVLTVQQAEALKGAVKNAISLAIEMMATGAVTPTAGAVATQVNSANPDLAITRNREMTASFTSSLATFVSVPVGQPAGTAVATATATAGAGVTSSRTKKAAAPTATSARGNGGNRNGQNRNGQNNPNANPNASPNANTQNGANRNAGNQAQTGRSGGNNKRGVRLPRVRSRIMRDIVFEEIA